MSYISYYDFIEAIRKWDVKIVKVLIYKVKQLKIPFSAHTYPTLDMIIEALYGVQSRLKTILGIKSCYLVLFNEL